ncbi:MAG TPA: type II secretion system minor pseudopilin GspK [Pseudohongiella sp.]|nr:type II secretion system minor pseudopilin GspK [Pseudohongiella sp.]
MRTAPLLQRGSALIIAMLIAALVAAISVRFAEAFLLQLNVADHRQQAQWQKVYVQGAEALAVQLLASDAQSSQQDHLQESWAQQVAPFPTDHGWVQPRLQDAQARFNLNNLVIKSAYQDDLGAPLTVRLSPPQKQFVRLLQTLGDDPISEADAVMMTEALVDWIDADDHLSGPGGAESLFYSADNPPRQAANQLLTDISELILVRHFSPALVERLRPLVTVLPVPTPLNLNTATLPLLRSINHADQLKPLASSVAQNILGRRQTQAFSGVDAFFQQPSMVALAADADISWKAGQVSLFSVDSQWFELESRVTVSGRSNSWRSLLHRPALETPDAGTSTTPQVWARSRAY